MRSETMRHETALHVMRGGWALRRGRLREDPRAAVSDPVVALALSLALVVFAPAGGAAQAAGPSVGEARLDSLSAEVDRLFDGWHRPDAPGAAVLVMKDGAVVHARGYGMANLEQGVPIRTTSVFDIASVSKQFAAFALALLEADGLLGWDDPVHRYLPELADFGRPLTLRHLVHHTGGVRDWPGTLAMAGWDYQDVMSFEQILRMAFHQTDLNFDPGSEYAYSNTGYNLIAEVVARVSGQSFRAFTHERIFRPLGMTRTHFHDDHTEVVADRADSYRPAPGGAPGYRNVVNSLTALGSSSLFTTVEDLARWIANFDDPVVGDARVFARMHERGILSGGDTIAYAGGQSEGRFRGSTRWSHTGSWAGYRTALFRHPDEGFAVVVLANRSDANPSALANRITELYLADVLDPPVVAQGGGGGGGGGGAGGGGAEAWSPTPGELAEYVGAYRSPETESTFHLLVREDGALVAHHFRTGVRVLRPVAPDRFQAPTFGQVVFLRDAEGRITGFTANQDRIRGFRFERLP
jgi:CubicO group peptidase (beta-lactamase class C family)